MRQEGEEFELRGCKLLTFRAHAARDVRASNDVKMQLNLRWVWDNFKTYRLNIQKQSAFAF